MTSTNNSNPNVLSSYLNIRSVRCVVWSCLALVEVMASSAAAQQTPPRFAASTEATTVDVTVVNDRGQPVLGLQPDDFVVQVDKRPRRVVTAEWVPMIAGDTAPNPPPEGYSTNETGSIGRLVVIVVDQPNLGFGSTALIQRAVEGFIDRLQPADRIAAVGIGPGIDSTAFTADRALVKRAISRMTGQKAKLIDDQFNITVSEALDVVDPGRQYAGTLYRVVNRECDGLVGVQWKTCALAVEATATAYGTEVLLNGRQTINRLRSLLLDLQELDAPKTMILVSEGFILGDEVAALAELGKLAAEAHTSIYSLKLSENADASRVYSPSTMRIEDRLTTSQGIEVLANVSRGSLFDVTVSAEFALERIESEISGYYLLGFESAPSDRDGRSHEVQVEVKRDGASVRSRRALRAGERARRTPREAALAALTSPLLLTALPLRVAAFSLQGPESERVQLLIHADVGEGYASPTPVSIAYVIMDREGRIVDSQTASARLQPVMNGVPSPLQYAAGASLPPGEYRLKLAIAEGDRAGSIEHPIRAGLVAAGPIRLSELMVGGPAGGPAPLRPMVNHNVNFGVLQGYLEAYGEGANRLTVRYEIAAGPDAPAILAEDIAGQPAGPERMIFNGMLAVRQLPPGTYTLRAHVSPAGDAAGLSNDPPTVMTRTFEIAPPAVLMTSAESAGTSAAPTDVFLPVPEGLLARAFRREEAAQPDILNAFRSRVDSVARPAFDAGVEALDRGDFVKAETSFKDAIEVQTESTGPLVYLAATFAASGHDAQAASAWQTALIEGSDLPQIYLWLSDALLRTRDLTQARTILEEAIAKWPGDVRFAKPLALVYATFGRGREAVRTLRLHLDKYPNDQEALPLAVEWIYHLHAAGVVAETRAEDVKRARAYGMAYEKVRGPQTQLALVREWIQYLERQRP
jgi:VWFA-related protein